MKNKLENESGDTAKSWWVIALKVIAYALGLILAGVGTTASAQMIGML